MSADDMMKAILEFTDKKHGKGVLPVEILDAQELLGVKLSYSYSFFLENFGWGHFSHEQVYGIGGDVPQHLDLIRNTFVERIAMVPSMPKHLIPVMNDGCGNHYCLMTSEFTNQECPVVFWDHELEEKQRPQIVSPAFSMWLIQMLSTLKP